MHTFKSTLLFILISFIHGTPVLHSDRRFPFKHKGPAVESQAHPMKATPVMIVKKPAPNKGTNNNVEDAVMVAAKGIDAGSASETSTTGTGTTDDTGSDLPVAVLPTDPAAAIIAKALSDNQKQKTAPTARRGSSGARRPGSQRRWAG